MSDVLVKKHESLATAKEILDSLREMFGQPSWSLRHKAIKYIYTKKMKKETSVREHELYMMMHFNIAEGALMPAFTHNPLNLLLLQCLPSPPFPSSLHSTSQVVMFSLAAVLVSFSPCAASPLSSPSAQFCSRRDLAKLCLLCHTLPHGNVVFLAIEGTPSTCSHPPSFASSLFVLVLVGSKPEPSPTRSCVEPFPSLSRVH
ncbi:gag/pol protein [Cucumis melo var. makuwa]|uniref:Gag/pol protein n=1 Tax=Cucumis melo var. makuwa TaxID=1194695 RepID=A0A5D3DFY7_CUCMM|nr:gag/pol protein [Cucumis melo var. makuwa]